MPISRIPEAEQKVSPFARLSASQIGRWRSCPRIWWYESKQKVKSPLPPVIALGNAVEECVCRVFRETPVLIETTAESRILISPLDENGWPKLDTADGWLGPTIEPLPREEWPVDESALAAWAHCRIDVHFDECWQSAIDDWKSLANRVGDEASLDIDVAKQMAHVAIDLQIEEVGRCMAANGGPNLDAWRLGKNRGEWPSPDGFPRKLSGPPVEANSDGPSTLVECWAIARPWFVDPDAKQFSSNTVHPEHWFQGEYDLIHFWDGSTRIIDLKASIGSNDRSATYVDQLQIYAWLWWRTHDRADEVAGLEVWYLGAPAAGAEARKQITPPSRIEMEQMEDEYQQLHMMLFADDLSIDDCPTTPRGLTPFKPGGIQDGPAQKPESRCRDCPHRGLCVKTEHDPELPSHQEIPYQGRPQMVTRLGDLNARHTVRGTVFTIIGPTIKSEGGVDFNFELRQGMDSATVKPAWGAKPMKVWRGLAKDTDVRVVGAIAKVWRGRLELEIDEIASIERSENPLDDEVDMIDIHPRANIVGRVWSIDAVHGILPNGNTSTRWALTIIDETGIAGVVAFKSMIPNAAPSVERGDWIGIVNGEVGEFAGRHQVRFGRGTTLVQLRDCEEIPEW